MPVRSRKRAARPPVDVDIADRELLDFALGFAGPRLTSPAASHLLSEFGNVDEILSSEPETLRSRGGLSNRAVAILKLLNTFRHDSRSRALLH